MNFFSAVSALVDHRAPVVRAAVWTVLAAFFVVSYTSIAKHLGRELPVPVIVFVRCIIGLLLFAPYFLRTKPAELKSDRPLLMLSRGLATMLALYCIFTAVSVIPIATVVAIQYSKPFVAALVAMIVLREIMTGPRWLTMAFGFAGMLLIVQPHAGTKTGDLFMFGVLLAIGAMLAESYGAITLKFLTRTNAPDKIVAWMVVGMLLASAIPGLIYWKTPNATQLAWLVAAAVAANMFQQCMARGYAAADATVVMPFEFSRLAFAATFGAIFFGEIASIWTWIGGAIILAAALWLAQMEKRARTAEESAAP
ncbi:MAG: DMT family transporter [Beijerinckiaceae bacterium]